MVKLQSIEYIENSLHVDDDYGNRDNKKDAKDINLDLKNSIKNNLYITVPSDINGVNYANYIVKKQKDIEDNTITYSSDMTIAQKLELLIQMKNNIRNHIITNLGKSRNDFYDESNKEKIPFVQYWKLISPLEKPTHLVLKASATKISWVKGATIKATLYDNDNVIIKNNYLEFQGNSYLATNGSYTFTVPSTAPKSATDYVVVYNGKTNEYSGCSNSVNITLTKDTPTLTAKTSNSIYSGYHAVYRFLNSQKKPIVNEKIQIKVGSNAYTDYKTNSDGEVLISVTKAETIKYKFKGNDKYNSVAEKSQKFTIKTNPTKSVCCGSMTQSPTSRTKPYQTWSDLYSDCTVSNYLRCGHESTGYNNLHTLGSSSGTFHQPSALLKTGIDFNIPKGATIKSVHVKWAEKQTNGPSVSTSKTSFINIKKVTLTTSGAISYNNTINTNSGGSTHGGSWVSHDVNLGTNFNPEKKMNLKLAYGPNESGNVGTIYVKGPQVTVEYIPKENS